MGLYSQNMAVIYVFIRVQSPDNKNCYAQLHATNSYTLILYLRSKMRTFICVIVVILHYLSDLNSSSTT